MQLREQEMQQSRIETQQWQKRGSVHALENTDNNGEREFVLLREYGALWQKCRALVWEDTPLLPRCRALSCNFCMMPTMTVQERYSFARIYISFAGIWGSFPGFQGFFVGM